MLDGAEFPGAESDSDVAGRCGARWYAVHCQPHREAAAAAHLRNQDYEVFLPLRESTRRHARKIDIVRRPFFPGYLFVCLDLAVEPWRPVNGTAGVVRIVMHASGPAPAPIGVIESLKECCDGAGILRWQPPLEPGQAVQIMCGPFAELAGELDRLDGQTRVRVLLNIMGGAVPAWLPRSHVVPAQAVI